MRCWLVLSCWMVILFSSCNKKIKLREVVYSDSLYQTIQIDPDALKSNDISVVSEFCSEIEYIPLETSDSVLIGNIKRLYVWNGHYYIWDGMSDVVFCFDENGRFLHKLDKKGGGPSEYYRISDMFLDTRSGNICIYSDMSQAVFVYTAQGNFIRKISLPIVMSTIAMENDKIFLYAGRMPNNVYFKDSYPEQYRFLSWSNDTIFNQQLAFTFHEEFLRVSVSPMNFTISNDGILLTEHLDPTVYHIDSLGVLTPRYKIKFLSNTLKFSFNDIGSLSLLQQAEKSGTHTFLFGGFYENNRYAFLCYSRKLVGGAYVTKDDGTVHNLGYLLFDDFNNVFLPMVTDFIDDNYLYKKMESIHFMKYASHEKASMKFKDMANRMNEEDNPIIIRMKLK